MNELPKTLQIKIAELNAQINRTVHAKSVSELKYPILTMDSLGEPEIVKPGYVYFRLERPTGHLGRYIFDRYEQD